jgi:prolactin
VISFLIAGTLLLLLLSNLLMWENVASVPRCIMEDGGCQKVLNYIFNMTSTISENFNNLSSETLNDFVSTSLTAGFSIKKCPMSVTGYTTG